MSKVFNLSEGKYCSSEYTCSPFDAVIAAYAQQVCNDWNTWDYRSKYGHMVSEGKNTFVIGDFCVLKDRQ